MILWHKNYFNYDSYTVIVGHPPIVKKISVKIPRKSMLEIQGRLTTSWILETDEPQLDERCVKKCSVYRK